MYTECPHCHTAFQVGPEDLRVAHGRVRCGRCDSVFDALASLSDEMPDALETDSEGSSESDEPAEPDHPGESGNQPPKEPFRFGDDTPLENVLALLGGDSAEEPPKDAPSSGTTEALGGAPDAVGRGGSIDREDGEDEGFIDTEDLGDEEEWQSLLAELDLDETSPGIYVGKPVATAGTSAGETGSAALSAETGAALVADFDGVPEEASGVEPPVLSAQTAPEESSDQQQTRQQHETDEDSLAASGILFDELVRSGEFSSILRQDAATSTVVADDDVVAGETPGDAAPESKAYSAADGMVSPVTADNLREEAGDGEDELLPSAPARSADDGRPAYPPVVADDESLQEEDEDVEAVARELWPRYDSRRRTIAWTAAATFLVLLLGAQVIHGQRAYLATQPDWGPRLQRLYGAFGAKLEPRWDIGALCVESSSGNAADRSLEIASVVVHRGDRPQPYPLLHVALTDRWQSVIGSRTITASDYLSGDSSRDARIRPGERLEALTRLADPGGEAAGYELHVCYRDSGSALRCAGACPQGR